MNNDSAFDTAMTFVVSQDGTMSSDDLHVTNNSLTGAGTVTADVTIPAGTATGDYDIYAANVSAAPSDGTTLAGWSNTSSTDALTVTTAPRGSSSRSTISSTRRPST